MRAFMFMALMSLGCEQPPATERPAIILFCTASCPACEYEKRSFRDPEVVRYINAHFTMRNVYDPDGTNAETKLYRVTSYPTVVVTTSNTVTKIEEVLSPAELLVRLKRVVGE